MKYLSKFITQINEMDKEAQHLSLLIKDQRQALLRYEEMLKNNAKHTDLALKESEIASDYEYNIEYQMAQVYALFHKIRYDFLNRAFDNEEINE